MIIKYLVFAMLFAGINAYEANDNTVIVPAVSSLDDLQHAINDANENVTTIINVDSFSLSNSSIKDAMRNLNINGKRIIIRGVNENVKITSEDQGSFYIIGQPDKTNDVTFENITFEQNIDQSKTIMTPNNAISLSKNSCSTNLKIKNCTFKNYTGAASSGGAIQASFSNADDYKLNIDIEGCSFVNCYSKIGGGAISVNGINNASLTLTDSTFDRCSAKIGGALLLQNVNTDITRCVFKDNENDNGGAIYLSNCKSFVSNNSFSNNYCETMDGCSVYIEDSKFNNNAFINNSFFNEVCDHKEFFFDASSGSLPEIKSKLYLNTFVSSKNIDLMYSEYSDHLDDFGNLYVSNKYSSSINISNYSAGTSNLSSIERHKELYYLSKDPSLKLNNQDIIAKLSTYYLNAYGDFYIGNNLSDEITVLYKGESKSYKIGESFELQSKRFGFDLVDNVVDGESFKFENSILSSNAPIIITPVYRINSVGVSTFIVSPTAIVLLASGTSLLVYLTKKKRATSTVADNGQSLAVDHTHISDNEKLSCLTTKEKEVLEFVLKNTPRKEIAAKLFISESTVKNHITKIYSKLNVKNKSELLEFLNDDKKQ